MKKALTIYSVTMVLSIFILSCTNFLKDKPSYDKMKECLADELANKAIVNSYEQQDGLTREKDGVKYYEGYFNAEIKFIANYGKFKAGEQYKIIKGTVSFMKTENGWNCQTFDISSANLIKIKEQGESSEHNSSNEEEVIPKQQSTCQTSPPVNSSEISGVFPQSSERILTVSDISGLTKWQLKIMRNEIFARHGYIFKTPDMQQYFSTQSWYKPLYDAVDYSLSKIEKNNIDFIKKYE